MAVDEVYCRKSWYFEVAGWNIKIPANDRNTVVYYILTFKI